MAELLQAAEHLDQEIPCLPTIAADHFANLRKHLDLESIRCANHAHEARHLHCAAALALRQSQPWRTFLVSRSQALRF
jgi:hypothetical protein